MAYPPSQGYPYGGPPQFQQHLPPQAYPPPGHLGGYPHPPQASYGHPPHQHSFGPPQGYPPQQQQPYGAVPSPFPQQQQLFQQAPYQQQAVAPVQPGYGAFPTPPSPGYGPMTVPPADATFATDELFKAMKGFGTNEGTLIRTLCHYPAEQITHLKTTYQQLFHRSLEKHIISETSGYFREALLGVLRGPLQQDVYILHKALHRIGTSEDMLNDVLIGRSNADMKAIKQAYQMTHNRTLESAVSSDLSAKTERLFLMILSATRQEDSAPFIQQNIEHDVSELHRATEGKLGTDQLTVCSILSNRNDGQIRAISQTYLGRYRIELEKVLAREFSGHMKKALVQMVQAASDRAMRDALAIEECCAGPGTKDVRLVALVTAVHWDRNHAGQVKGAYRHRFGSELINRLKGETSGHYERMLVAMIE